MHFSITAVTSSVRQKRLLMLDISPRTDITPQARTTTRRAKKLQIGLNLGHSQTGLSLYHSSNAALLPEPFKAWLSDITERIQCPPEFPAVGAIVALAGVVGRRIGIRPKRYDDWLVIPNLWGAVVGRPGIMKTPRSRKC